MKFLKRTALLFLVSLLLALTACDYNTSLTQEETLVALNELATEMNLGVSFTAVTPEDLENQSAILGICWKDLSNDPYIYTEIFIEDLSAWNNTEYTPFLFQANNKLLVYDGGLDYSLYHKLTRNDAGKEDGIEILHTGEKIPFGNRVERTARTENANFAIVVESSVLLGSGVTKADVCKYDKLSYTDVFSAVLPQIDLTYYGLNDLDALLLS